MIIERCLSEDGEEDLSGEMEEERSFREIGANLLRLVILVLKIIGAGTLIVIGLIVLVTLFYSTPTGIVSLDTEINRLFSLLTVFAIFLYYVFEGVERKIVEFFDYLMKSHHTFLFIFCAVLIAALIPVYDELTRSVHLGQLKLEKEGICQITNLGIGPNHVHSIQIVIWLIYMAIIGILFEAANRKRGAGKSLKDWPKGDRVTFVMMTLFASGAILMVIAIIQEEIRVAFEPCFSSEQAILVTNGVRILVG